MSDLEEIKQILEHNSAMLQENSVALRDLAKKIVKSGSSTTDNDGALDIINTGSRDNRQFARLIEDGHLTKSQKIGRSWQHDVAELEEVRKKIRNREIIIRVNKRK